MQGRFTASSRKFSQSIKKKEGERELVDVRSEEIGERFLFVAETGHGGRIAQADCSQSSLYDLKANRNKKDIGINNKSPAQQGTKGEAR